MKNTGFKCLAAFFYCGKNRGRILFIFYIEIKGENHYNNVRVTAWSVFEKVSGSKESVTASNRITVQRQCSEKRVAVKVVDSNKNTKDVR